MGKNNELGEFIRNCRKSQSITLRELAKKSSISFSHLSKIERGEHTPTKVTLQLLATALNIDKDKLYLLAGYVPENEEDEKTRKDKITSIYFPEVDPEVERRNAAIKKISDEFPNADLMFNDLSKMNADQLEEVYNFIKYQLSKGD